MTEEEKGFTVKDRRLFSEDGEADGRPDEDEKPETQTQSASQDPPDMGEPEEPRAEKRVLPPPDFGFLIVSLSQSALLHLGLTPDPISGETRPDMQLARHSIDTIAMLREKTQGNLTEQESQLVDHVLTDLRMAFVRANSQ